MAKFYFCGLAMGEHVKDGKVYAKAGECIRFEMGNVIAGDGHNIKIMKFIDGWEFEYWLTNVEQTVKK
jgi:hypothetical protein